MSSLNKSILIGTVWSLFGQFGAMFIALAANVILARILTPFEFGQMGVIMFFIVLANVFAESGLAGALIRKGTVTNADYSTVFIFNIIISSILFIVLVFSSSIIAESYNDSALRNLIIASGLILFINAFQITQNAKMSRALKFKQKTLYRIIAIFFSSVISVFCALNGFGVWSLIVMQLLTSLFTTILMCVNESFDISLKFDKLAFKELYGFGINTTLASILNISFDNIYQLILARYFSMNQVGLFYQAKKLQEVPVNAMMITTQGVVFSSLAKLQEEKIIFVKTYNRIVLLFTIGTGFITGFVFLYSDDLINTLYGAKWIGSSFYMKLLCIASFFYMQEMCTLVIFKVFNQTKKVLWLEIFKKVIQTITIILGVVMLDLKILLYGFIFTNIISYLMNFYYSRSVMGDVSWNELILVVKVLLSILLSVFVSNILIFPLIQAKYILFTSPIFLIIYLSVIQLLKVCSLLEEFNAIKLLLKGEKI